MSLEFTVRLKPRTGTLARLGGVLGDAGINISAIQTMPCRGIGIMRFIPDNPDLTAMTLKGAGIAYTTREVLLVNVLDEPGSLGDVALVMSEAGINIDAVYLTDRGQVVLGVDDLHGAIQVAAGMAVV